MKKIINGKKYDTDTASIIGKWENGYGYTDFRFCEETLYRKRTGEFFLYGKGGAMTRWSEGIGNCRCHGEGILPLTLDEAKEWVETHLTADEYETLFGQVEE